MVQEPKEPVVPNWETCRIEVREERRIPVAFYSAVDQIYYRMFALVDTPQGQKVIAWSGAWSQISDGPEQQLRQDQEKRDQERTRLIDRLRAEGWEPVESDHAGEVNTLRRPAARK